MYLDMYHINKFNRENHAIFPTIISNSLTLREGIRRAYKAPSKQPGKFPESPSNLTAAVSGILAFKGFCARAARGSDTVFSSAVTSLAELDNSSIEDRPTARRYCCSMKPKQEILAHISLNALSMDCPNTTYGGFRKYDCETGR